MIKGQAMVHFSGEGWSTVNGTSMVGTNLIGNEELPLIELTENCPGPLTSRTYAKA